MPAVHECLEGSEPRESTQGEWTGLEEAFFGTGKTWKPEPDQPAVLEGILTSPEDGNIFTVDFTIENVAEVVVTLTDASNQETRLDDEFVSLTASDIRDNLLTCQKASVCYTF